MTDEQPDVQAEILATLKSIDAKLSPRPVEIKQGHRVKLGKVFSVGQTIPDHVDLVIDAAGVRWKRAFDDMQVPLDQWYPRDGEGAIVSTNELLARNGHVTEVPAPGGQAGT